MRKIGCFVAFAAFGLAVLQMVPLSGQGNSVGNRQDGKRLFERETFGGNGRTCLTCHSLETGTVSPRDAQSRFLRNPADALFLHDGSDETSRFHPLPVPPGSRFQGVLVSEINAANNPVRTFVFTNPDGSKTELATPDPGRALITGRSDDDVVGGIPLFNNVNAFKIPTLRALRRTAPYFHDNSAKTLEDVAAHYALFFAIVTDPDGPGPEEPGIVINEQDQADIVAFMKLLN